MQVGDAYLIVYSITDRASFEKASELRIQLRRARQKEDIPIILVGNKSDLVRCREVSVAGKENNEDKNDINIKSHLVALEQNAELWLREYAVIRTGQ